MSYPANLRGWGPGWPANRASDMATVRTRYNQTLQVHKVIAPIVQFLFDEIERRGYLIHAPGDTPDDWGFASRPIRGKNTPSNHSWGLAFDIDATRYPMGTRRNPPRWITDLIVSYGFEWGGPWSRPDPMHYEFAGSITEARFLVSMLAASHVADQPPAKPDTVPDAPEEDDMLSAYIRFTEPGHRRHGRIEVVNDMFRRHIPAEEWSLIGPMGAERLVQNVDPPTFDKLTSNKQVIG